ncbi:MAG TPA: DUF3658 domain-containing protein [Terriglobales bacterium]|nr:DUF3658 domain-containing protein [Terriglobales bacterium]
MPDDRVIHVVFGSAEESLREAIYEAGWGEEVVSTYDLFSTGPIAAGPVTPVEMAARAQAMNGILGTAIWEMTVALNAPLLSISLADGVLPVVWFSRRDANSYAGFLWWLSQRGEGPCEIVDVTDTILPLRKFQGARLEKRLAVSPGLVPPEDMIILREEARSLSATERRRYQEMWLRLVRENASLRLVEGDELVSKPVSHFDPLLLSCVVDNWRKMARVIGEAMMTGFNDDVHQVGDFFLHARLRAVVESGAIEAVGDVMRMGYCEVRLRSRSKRKRS